MLNRANFGVPELRAFAGQADDEAPLATFGRISNTVTSSRQIQLGIGRRFLQRRAQLQRARPLHVRRNVADGDVRLNASR